MFAIASDPAFILAAMTAAFLVGLSKGGLAMIGSLGVPVLALAISPVKAAALLLPIYVVSDMFGLWAYRREFSMRNLAILAPSAVLGIAIGWATASFVSDRVVGLLIGVIGLAYCLNTWRLRNRPTIPRTATMPAGIFWGTITGFTSFVSHSGGPPTQVYLLPQRLEKLVYAGTTTILFAIVNAVKLVPYWALGQFSTENLRASLYLMPIAIAATQIGVRLVRVLPERPFYIFVQASLFLVSLKLLADGILG